MPLNYQWAFWGWPNRTIQRMDKVGARVLIIGPYGEDRHMGLTLPEQLGKIPASFKGYVWVDDIWTVGPALRPNRDIRTEEQQAAAEAGLKRRREKKDVLPELVSGRGNRAEHGGGEMLKDICAEGAGRGPRAAHATFGENHLPEVISLAIASSASRGPLSTGVNIRLSAISCTSSVSDAQLAIELHRAAHSRIDLP